MCADKKTTFVVTYPWWEKIWKSGSSFQGNLTILGEIVIFSNKEIPKKLVGNVTTFLGNIHIFPALHISVNMPNGSSLETFTVSTNRVYMLSSHYKHKRFSMPSDNMYNISRSSVPTSSFSGNTSPRLEISADHNLDLVVASP